MFPLRAYHRQRALLSVTARVGAGRVSANACGLWATCLRLGQTLGPWVVMPNTTVLLLMREHAFHV